MNFEDLKVGDRVYRMLGGEDGVCMEMQVVELKGNLIVCAAVPRNIKGDEKIVLFNGGWTFDRNSGVEEDDYLKWGIEYGQTGSYLKRKTT